MLIIVHVKARLHDGRLLTLDDTVEFFNLMLGTKLDSMAWLRPVNVTANVGVALPTETASPNVLLWSFALEYSLLTTYSGERKGSRYSRGWVPLVEFAFQRPLDGPLAGQTTGTINPGVVWVDRYLQVAVEAVFPINARTGRDVGVRAQAHLYLSEIFPDTLGKPTFGK